MIYGIFNPHESPPWQLLHRSYMQNPGYITDIKNRHPKQQGTVYFKVTGCRKCEFSKYCKRWQKRKSENYKIFEVNIDLRRYIQEAEQNLLSIKGIEIRVNRSCQNEGSYGVLKQNILPTHLFRHQKQENVYFSPDKNNFHTKNQP